MDTPHFLTPSHNCRSLLEAVTAAVRGGATILQIREKDIDGGDFFTEAAAALKVWVGLFVCGFRGVCKYHPKLNQTKLK